MEDRTLTSHIVQGIGQIAVKSGIKHVLYYKLAGFMWKKEIREKYRSNKYFTFCK